MSNVSLCLALALPLAAGTIIPNNQPDYGPQLPPGLTQFSGPIPLSSLQRQFPQYDYAQYGGLTCYFDLVNPAIHDICAPPVVPWTPPEFDDFVFSPALLRPVAIPPLIVTPVVIPPSHAVQPCDPPAPVDTPEPGTCLLIGIALVCVKVRKGIGGVRG